MSPDTMGTAQVIRANARDLPLADDSVDLICTSPPYFALRSYTDDGAHYAGQIGDEATPAEFVDSLIEVTAECMRVLKPSGSLWVNLGDKYAGRTGGPQGSSGARATRSQAATYEELRPLNGAGFQNAPQARQSTNPSKSGSLRWDDAQSGHTGQTIRDKSLIGNPWRYALRCIDDLGLILRAEVIWSKPNGLPESVTDRVRRSHEQWFHFTLNPRYYSAVDEIREAHAEGGHSRRADGQPSPKQAAGLANGTRRGYMPETYTNPLGKLPGSVWVVPTEPLRVPDHLGVDHFAAFPTEWPKRIIRGWSPAGVCTACGEGRRPVVAKELEHINFTSHAKTQQGHETHQGVRKHVRDNPKPVARESAAITGYACACPEPTADTTPAVVLDPFGGTGTTALVAKALGRHGISVDMSADYCRLARWRTNDRDQLAKVLGIPKADQEPTDTPSLFDLIDGGAA